jgi:hypothetical protein
MSVNFNLLAQAIVKVIKLLEKWEIEMRTENLKYLMTNSMRTI